MPQLRENFVRIHISPPRFCMNGSGGEPGRTQVRSTIVAGECQVCSNNVHP